VTNHTISMMKMLLVVLVVGCLVCEGQGYCFAPGSNPSFREPPIVQQVNLTAVLVSWEGSVNMQQCVDQFLVKSGQKFAVNNYEMSQKLSKLTFSLVIANRVPMVEYFYQVIAREDKGLLGVDYNKSPETIFATSRDKVNLREDRVPTPPPPPPTARPVQLQGSDGKAEYSAAEGVVKREEEAGTNLLGMNLVWIIVGVLAAVIIIAGVIYNLMKRSKGEKGMELESNLGSDYDEDEDEDEDEAGSDDGDEDEEGSEGEDSDHDNKSAFQKIQTYDA